MRLMSRYRNKVIEIGMNILVLVRSLVDSPACGFYQLVKFRILHKVKDLFINWMHKSNVFVPSQQGKETKMLSDYVFLIMLKTDSGFFRKSRCSSRKVIANRKKAGIALFVCLFTVPLCGSWQCVQREYRRPHSPAPRSSTPSVFNSNIPSPTAFLGRSVFLCTVPLSLLPVVAQWAQRKPPSDSVSMGHSWGKSLESYFGV